jgi:hypothetical protein
LKSEISLGIHFPDPKHTMEYDYISLHEDLRSIRGGYGHISSKRKKMNGLS